MAVSAMVLIAVLWGSSAVVLKGLLARVPAADLLGVRFTLATLVLVAVAPRALRMSRRTLRNGVILGSLFAAAQLTQTIGLEHTSASVSGFLTGLYVVVTPLLSWVILGRRPGRAVWVAIALATVGLAAFTVLPALSSGGSISFGWGEALTLVSAVLFAAHIISAGRRATPDAALSLTIVQTGMAAVASLVMAAPSGITLPRGADWLPMAYVAVICGALCLFLQIWAQSHLDPVRSAVIMCSEPLWVAVFAIAFAGEVLSVPLLVGGITIVAAMVVVVVPGRALLPVLGRRRRAAFTRAA